MTYGQRPIVDRLAGRFVTLDGCDGCGKTTVITKLAKLIADAGCRVCVCKDPGTTKLGESIRAIVKGTSTYLSTEMELKLFEVARESLYTEVIAPALLDKEVVLCDRYINSTYVYQLLKYNNRFIKRLGDEGATIEIFRRLNKIYTEYRDRMEPPSDQFVLKVSCETALKRIRSRANADADRFESAEMIKPIIDGFDILCSNSSYSFVTHGIITIDGERPVDGIVEDIFNQLVLKK